jgi:hypothetical protein
LVTCVRFLDFDIGQNVRATLARDVSDATRISMRHLSRHAVLASAFLFFGCAPDGEGAELTAREELVVDSRAHFITIQSV